MRRSKFFDSMEQLVTIRRIIDKDGRDTREEDTVFKTALVSTSGVSLPANAATIPDGTIKVFLEEKLSTDYGVGDKIAIWSLGDTIDFIYTIQLIDTNVAGANARRYKTRIEARRKA